MSEFGNLVNIGNKQGWCRDITKMVAMHRRTIKRPVTSVLGLRTKETRINWGFRKKKTSCTLANSGVHWKKKLYGGCNA